MCWSCLTLLIQIHIESLRRPRDPPADHKLQSTPIIPYLNHKLEMFQGFEHKNNYIFSNGKQTEHGLRRYQICTSFIMPRIQFLFFLSSPIDWMIKHYTATKLIYAVADEMHSHIGIG